MRTLFRICRGLIVLPFFILMVICLYIVHVIYPEGSNAFWNAYAKTFLGIENELKR